MHAYQDVGDLWNLKIQFRGNTPAMQQVDRILTRYGIQITTLGGRTGGYHLGDRYSEVDSGIMMQAVWLVAARKLAIARTALDGGSIHDEDKAVLADTVSWYKSESKPKKAKADNGKSIADSVMSATQQGAQKVKEALKEPNVEAAPKANKDHAGSPGEATATHFVGRWKLVDDKGVPSSYLTVTRDFKAMRDHARDYPGTWEVVGNEARFTWEDGFRDIMRRENGEIKYLGLGKIGTAWDSAPNFRLRAVRMP
jgi:hypothetical protein